MSVLIGRGGQSQSGVCVCVGIVEALGLCFVLFGLIYCYCSSLHCHISFDFLFHSYICFFVHLFIRVVTAGLLCLPFYFVFLFSVCFVQVGVCFAFVLLHLDEQIICFIFYYCRFCVSVNSFLFLQLQLFLQLFIRVVTDNARLYLVVIRLRVLFYFVFLFVLLSKNLRLSFVSIFA